eukprot:7061914-Pyramimonas_sp.AAC.1
MAQYFDEDLLDSEPLDTTRRRQPCALPGHLDGVPRGGGILPNPRRTAVGSEFARVPAGPGDE